MAAYAVDVDAGLAEVDAESAGITGIGDQLGGVQQGLRRDAADVQAGAAGLSAASMSVTFMPLSAARNAAA